VELDDVFKGKMALVTGSTSGIGRAIARAFAAQGANLMINGFGDYDVIDAWREDWKTAYGVDIVYSAADVSKPAEAASLIAAAEARFGAVDILVNNAGIQHTAPLESFPLDKWDAIMGVNLSAAFYTTRLVLTKMREKKWGRIINISSMHGLVASPHRAAYVAAKHGVVGLTRVTALETAGMGITCNAICPGWVLTPLSKKSVDALALERKLSTEDAKRALVGEKMPSKEFVTPEQLAGIAVFLCSAAADSITGVPLPVDGDWSAW